jgi:hypothetical protein
MIKLIHPFGLLVGVLLLLGGCGVAVSGNGLSAVQPVTEPESLQPESEALSKSEAVKEEAMTAPTLSVKAGSTEAQLRILAELPDNGPAPELLNEVWLNSEPLRLAELRGRVVIIEFWTYG